MPRHLRGLERRVQLLDLPERLCINLWGRIVEKLVVGRENNFLMPRYGHLVFICLTLLQAGKADLIALDRVTLRHQVLVLRHLLDRGLARLMNHHQLLFLPI